jgi:hypothetical protein
MRIDWGRRGRLRLGRWHDGWWRWGGSLRPRRWHGWLRRRVGLERFVAPGSARRRFLDIETVHDLRLGRLGWLGTCATDQRADARGQYTGQKTFSHLGHDTIRVNNSQVIVPPCAHSWLKSDALWGGVLGW